MPKKKSNTINDPFLNQFVYDCLWLATKEQRQNLKGKEIRPLKSSKIARNFAANSNLEEKIALLSRLGISFFFGFGTMDNQVLTDLHKKYKEDKLIPAVKELIDRRVFVVTSKEVMMYMGLMASNVHSDSYVMNRNYLKMGYHINHWKKDEISPVDDAVNDSMTAAREISKIMIHSILLSNYGDEFGGLNEVGICILLFLFSKKGFDCPEIDIKNLIEPLYNPQKTTLSIKKCIDNKFIMKSLKNIKKPAYRITDLGVQAAMKFQARVLNVSANF